MKRRKGKHKTIVNEILSALDRLPHGEVIRTTLGERQKEIRGALYYEARQSGRKIATLKDGKLLYVWNKMTAVS